MGTDMATDGPVPPPCNPDIFKDGKPIVSIDGSSNAVERWVQMIASEANAQVDWHYSGGVAQVLHLGDDESRLRVIEAIFLHEPKLKGRIIHRFMVGEKGLTRNGVSEVPAGALASQTEDGATSTFI